LQIAESRTVIYHIVRSNEAPRNPAKFTVKSHLSDSAMGRVIYGNNCSLFGWPLRLKFFARKDGQDGQYNEHCDLIGKGNGQEIVRYTDYECGKANPHQIATPRKQFCKYEEKPKRKPEPMR
jgi:hypothetical protein